MGWEWRIFFKNLNHKPWRSERQDEIENMFMMASSDKQPYYYFNLRDPEAGLKERWEKIPKLELKVRQEVREQLELWEKCMSYPLPSKSAEDRGIDVETIRRCLQMAKNEARGQGVISNKSVEAIKRIRDRLEHQKPARVTISKERRQIRALTDETGYWTLLLEKTDHPDAVIIERTSISTSQGPQTFMTICVEGENPQSVRKFVQAFVQIAVGNIMGYPEFLMALGS